MNRKKLEFINFVDSRVGENDISFSRKYRENIYKKTFDFIDEFSGKFIYVDDCKDCEFVIELNNDNKGKALIFESIMEIMRILQKARKSFSVSPIWFDNLSTKIVIDGAKAIIADKRYFDHVDQRCRATDLVYELKETRND